MTNDEDLEYKKTDPDIAGSEKAKKQKGTYNRFIDTFLHLKDLFVLIKVYQKWRDL